METDAAALLVDQYRALARYNAWMNRSLYAVAATLSDEERTRDLGAFFRSVHGTLNHILLADRAWLGRFTEPSRGRSLDAAGAPIVVRALGQELYADFETLRRERAATDGTLAAWVATLTPAELAATFGYRTTDGQRCEHPLWWAVTHFFNHQTHHRGQVTTLLKQLGRDPGVTDLVIMLRTEPA
jgi:uncharacterized damage-inducible protein DinB